MTLTQADFTWMFKDPEWKNKFLIGSLLSLAGVYFPLLGLGALVIVYGYALGLMRAVMRSEPRALPKWENYGELFLDGAKAALSAIVYFLPGMILFTCAVLFLLTGIFGGALAQSPRGSSGDGGSLLFFLTGELGFFACFGIGMLVYLIGFVLMPVAVGQYARTGEIAAGYRWSEVKSVLRANLSGFLVALAAYWGIAMGLGFVVSILIYTIILCLFIPFLMAPVAFYTALLFAQFFGEAYREGALKAGLITA